MPQSPELPRCWLVRGERQGADERFNYQAGVTSIHWNDAPDPHTHSREELESFFASHPQSGGANAAEQVWRFCHEMQIGDVVVTPLWNQGRKYDKVMVGVVIGPYRRLAYDPEPAPRQTRLVEWRRADLDREELRTTTQERLVYRYTCRRIHDDDLIRDILTHAGIVTAPDVSRHGQEEV